jgi:enoyl-CoA hydratase
MNLSGETFKQYGTIALERDERLTWLILNRPDRRNALSHAMLRDISAALDVLAKDKQTRVVAIVGAGSSFSSGYDFKDDESNVAVQRDIVEDYDDLVHNLNIFMKVWDHPKPVIAAVHGYCLAGATQLCVCCDITVVAEDSIIGLPPIPAGGGYITPLWVPLVGPKRAKQMSFVPGSRITGAQASEWGWANYSVPADALRDDVRSLAFQIAKVPSSILQMKKASITRAADAMGFRHLVPMGAETDALIHYSQAARGLSDAVREYGHKEAVAKFEAGDLAVGD